MSVLNKKMNIGLLILRISVALMLFHGISKLIHGIGPIEGMVTSAGLPAFFALGVYIGEIVAPLLVLFGFATRIGAAIIAFNMVVAVLMAHAGHIFSLNQTGGWAIELPAMYFLASLALIFTGAGKYALSNKNFWD